MTKIQTVSLHSQCFVRNICFSGCQCTAKKNVQDEKNEAGKKPVLIETAAKNYPYLPAPNLKKWGEKVEANRAKSCKLDQVVELAKFKFYFFIKRGQGSR